MPGASFALGSGIDAIIVSKRDVNDSTLIRSHRSHLHAAMLACSFIGSGARDGFELLTLTALIPLDVNNNRITEAHRADSDGGNDKLQGIERTTMSTNQYRKIVTGDIEDKLPFVTLIFVDRHFANIEILQDVLQSGNSGIGDSVELFFRDFDLIFTQSYSSCFT